MSGGEGEPGGSRQLRPLHSGPLDEARASSQVELGQEQGRAERRRRLNKGGNVVASSVSGPALGPVRCVHGVAGPSSASRALAAASAATKASTAARIGALSSSSRRMRCGPHLARMALRPAATNRGSFSRITEAAPDTGITPKMGRVTSPGPLVREPLTRGCLPEESGKYRSSLPRGRARHCGYPPKCWPSGQAGQVTYIASRRVGASSGAADRGRWPRRTRDGTA